MSESKTGNDDGNHADCDDSESFNSDQEEEIDDFTDDIFEPIHPTSEVNPDHVPETGTASGLVEEEGHVGCQQNLQGFGLLNLDIGQETSIMDDMLNYGDIERLLDGMVVQSFPETVSEAETWDDKEGRIVADMRDSEANQTIPDKAGSLAPTSSSHRDGENSGSVTGAVDESDNGEAVPVSPLGSGSQAAIGNNIDAPTAASADSEQGDGGNRASTRSASTSRDHGEVEHSSVATPALTFSEYSAGGNSELVTPRSTAFHEWRGSPVVPSSAGSDHDDADERGSETETAIPADSGKTIEDKKEPSTF